MNKYLIDCNGIVIAEGDIIVSEKYYTVNGTRYPKTIASFIETDLIAEKGKKKIIKGELIDIEEENTKKIYQDKYKQAGDIHNSVKNKIPYVIKNVTYYQKNTDLDIMLATLKMFEYGSLTEVVWTFTGGEERVNYTFVSFEDFKAFFISCVAYCEKLYIIKQTIRAEIDAVKDKKDNLEEYDVAGRHQSLIEELM